MLKILLRQHMIRNPCCSLVVGCRLVYFVLISLASNYYDGQGWIEGRGCLEY